MESITLKGRPTKEIVADIYAAFGPNFQWTETCRWMLDALLHVDNISGEIKTEDDVVFETARLAQYLLLAWPSEEHAADSARAKELYREFGEQTIIPAL